MIASDPISGTPSLLLVHQSEESHRTPGAHHLQLAFLQIAEEQDDPHTGGLCRDVQPSPHSLVQRVGTGNDNRDPRCSVRAMPQLPNTRLHQQIAQHLRGDAGPVTSDDGAAQIDGRAGVGGRLAADVAQGVQLRLHRHQPLADPDPEVLREHLAEAVPFVQGQLGCGTCRCRILTGYSPDSPPNPAHRQIGLQYLDDLVQNPVSKGSLLASRSFQVGVKCLDQHISHVGRSQTAHQVAAGCLLGEQRYR